MALTILSFWQSRGAVSIALLFQSSEAANDESIWPPWNLQENDATPYPVPHKVGGFKDYPITLW